MIAIRVSDCGADEQTAIKDARRAEGAEPSHVAGIGSPTPVLDVRSGVARRHGVAAP
jgi:hypothetical protein